MLWALSSVFKLWQSQTSEIMTADEGWTGGMKPYPKPRHAWENEPGFIF